MNQLIYLSMKMRKSTFSILFFIKRKAVKKDGAAPIMCRITVNGTATAFSCKIGVNPCLWDSKAGKTRGKDENSKLLNSKIKEIRKGVVKHYDKIFNGIGPLTAERVKISYLGFDRYNRTLLQVFESHNKEYEEFVKNGIRRVSTYQRYCNVLKHLEEFLNKKYNMEDIALVDIRSSFITDFELYLRKKGCANNTICIYITPLKKMISIAQSNGWLDYNPFSSYHIPLKKKDRIFLTMEEIETIINFEFTKHKKSYDLIRDMFLFCSFTGVSYIDLKNLTKKHLKKENNETWLCFERHKTGIICNVPLLKIPLDILTKYQPLKNKDNLFPVPKYQTLLSGIKRIAELCGIKKELSWHCSRHTFATEICLSNGVPIETISRMLGHADVKTTQIYAKVSNAMIHRDMTNLSDRLNGVSRSIR